MKKLLKIFFIITFCLVSFIPVLAQDSFTLSITPPLIKNNASPGEKWRSSIKIVNNNSRKIDAYAQVLDFKSGSESGTVEFIKNPNDSSEQAQHLLSGWVEVEPGPYAIEAYESRDIGFTINIPESAEPGGHYAAILIGTKPPEDKIKGSAIKISSLLGSLILLNVNGDAIESGRIREFSTDKKCYNKPDINFSVRFENTGSVHIQPQGEIKIFNFLGKEKKIIPINHYTKLGNILPNSIRKWDFNWTADSSIWEMGRYRAELVFGYGENARQSTDQAIHFWIINIKILLIIFSSVLFVFLLFLFFVKAYIKRAIKLTQGRAGLIVVDEKNKKKINVTEEKISKNDINKAIIKNTNKKLLVKNQASPSKEEGKIKWGLFSVVIKIVIVFLIILLAFFIYLSYKNNFNFFKKFLNINTTSVEIIEVEKENNAGVVLEKENTISSTTEEEKEKADETEEATSTLEFEEDDIASNTELDEQKNSKETKIEVLNGSGQSGLAGKAAEIIKQSGMLVAGLGNADNFEYDFSVIKYKSDYTEEANRIKKLFSFEIEMLQVSDQDYDIVVIVGGNYKQ
ncbi:hypothetical protein DRH27_03220 [Candidatus Falkowbacteria bacterium]|nr:MAG: hypothetical protein DRH27_03220 [Candidatus Falkowbacteria bacterium]